MPSADMGLTSHYLDFPRTAQRDFKATTPILFKCADPEKIQGFRRDGRLQPHQRRREPAREQPAVHGANGKSPDPDISGRGRL